MSTTYPTLPFRLDLHSVQVYRALPSEEWGGSCLYIFAGDDTDLRLAAEAGGGVYLSPEITPSRCPASYRVKASAAPDAKSYQD